MNTLTTVESFAQLQKDTGFSQEALEQFASLHPFELELYQDGTTGESHAAFIYRGQPFFFFSLSHPDTERGMIYQVSSEMISPTQAYHRSCQEPVCTCATPEFNWRHSPFQLCGLDANPLSKHSTISILYAVATCQRCNRSFLHVDSRPTSFPAIEDGVEALARELSFNDKFYCQATTTSQLWLLWEIHEELKSILAEIPETPAVPRLHVDLPDPAFPWF